MPYVIALICLVRPCWSLTHSQCQCCSLYFFGRYEGWLSMYVNEQGLSLARSFSLSLRFVNAFCFLGLNEACNWNVESQFGSNWPWKCNNRNMSIPSTSSKWASPLLYFIDIQGSRTKPYRNMEEERERHTHEGGRMRSIYPSLSHLSQKQ